MAVSLSSSGGNSGSLSYCLKVIPRFPDHMERRSPSPSWVLHTAFVTILVLQEKQVCSFNTETLCSCVAVGPDKQCELTCRPAGYRFYVRLAERVRDGTPCFNASSNDVCVEGQCLVSKFTCSCVKGYFLTRLNLRLLCLAWPDVN